MALSADLTELLARLAAMPLRDREIVLAQLGDDQVRRLAPMLHSMQQLQRSPELDQLVTAAKLDEAHGTITALAAKALAQTAVRLEAPTQLDPRTGPGLSAPTLVARALSLVGLGS